MHYIMYRNLMMDYGSMSIAIYGKVFVIWSSNAHEFIGESEIMYV